MELDKEEVLNELMNFEKNYGRDCESGLPDCLERFLVNIAKTGDTIYPWNKIKPVILKKIELVVTDFNTNYPYENNPVLPNVKPFNFQEMKDEIIEKFDYFYGAPFTIQRICELLTEPSKYYKRSDKFMRGLEKNVRVISTVEARRPDIENEPNSFQKEFTRSPKNNSSPLASSSNILLSSPLPSSSTSSQSSLASSSSAFMNGLNEKEESTSTVLSIASRLSQSCSPIQDQGPLPNSPAPLQQLDSFTTVFASPPSTPLAVVSDIHPYDAGSPSSSSSSSSDSSPQPSSSSSPPPTHDESELNQPIDADFEDSKHKDDNSNDSKSEDSNEPTKLDVPLDEPMDQTSEEKSGEISEKLEAVEDLIKLDTSNTKSEPIKDDTPSNIAAIKEDEKESTVEQCLMKEPVNEEKILEVAGSISSLNESSSEKKQENVYPSPTLTNEKSPVKLLESLNDQQKDNMKSIETSQSFVAASTADASIPSGQKEESVENSTVDAVKCSGDNLNESTDSGKTESTESVNNSFEDNLTPEKEKDKDKDLDLDQDNGQETSSGSSTISAEETTDNSLNTSYPQSNIDEKPESH